MHRERVIDRLEQEWQVFLQSFAELPANVFLEPGAVGHWSVRDVLTHVTTWEEEALKALPLILNDKPLPRYGGIDAFNAREQERKRSLSLEQVRKELAATHQNLIAFLEKAPDSAFATGGRFLRRLRLDTYHHYREHATQIMAWRTKRGV